MKRNCPLSRRPTDGPSRLANPSRKHLARERILFAQVNCRLPQFWGTVFLTYKPKEVQKSAGDARVWNCYGHSSSVFFRGLEYRNHLTMTGLQQKVIKLFWTIAQSFTLAAPRNTGPLSKIWAWSVSITTPQYKKNIKSFFLREDLQTEPLRRNDTQIRYG